VLHIFQSVKNLRKKLPLTFYLSLFNSNHIIDSVTQSKRKSRGAWHMIKTRNILLELSANALGLCPFSKNGYVYCTTFSIFLWDLLISGPYLMAIWDSALAKHRQLWNMKCTMNHWARLVLLPHSYVGFGPSDVIRIVFAHANVNVFFRAAQQFSRPVKISQFFKIIWVGPLG